MKRMMIVALACLGLHAFCGVEQELDEQIDKLSAEVKKLDVWQKGIARICGISIGDTLDDIKKNNIFKEEPGLKEWVYDGRIESVYGMLAKPFRRFFCAEVFFTPSGKAWKIKFSMPAENFTQVRAEAEQIVPILQKHFGENMGDCDKKQNDSAEVNYRFYYYPDKSITYPNGVTWRESSFSWINSTEKAKDPVFGSKALYMELRNGMFSLREEKMVSLQELQERKSKLKKSDEGIDAL